MARSVAADGGGSMARGTTIAALVAVATVAVGCTSGANSPAAGANTGPPGSSDACNPPRQDGVELTFASFGGSFQEAQRRAWQEPYTELTGVQFINDENTNIATIQSQVESGQVTWDVVDVYNEFGLNSHAALLEPLNYEVIPRSEIDPDLGTTDFRVPTSTYGTVLGYNTEMTGGKTPTGWADFFDMSAFPGKRGVYDYATGGIFEIALLADGVAPTDLYPLDLDRAIAKLDTLKDDIVFWTSGAQSRELIGSGEVTMTMIWNGRAWNAIHDDNQPVGITWNQQIVSADYFVVPKGTPNREAAMRFIAYTTCAETNGNLSSYIPYGPTNVNAEPDPAVVDDLPLNHVDANTAYFDDAYIVDHFKEIDAVWHDWKSR
jgi:putative spermidine/putrescine transport system substrate-binding protein